MAAQKKTARQPAKAAAQPEAPKKPVRLRMVLADPRRYIGTTVYKEGDELGVAELKAGISGIDFDVAVRAGAVAFRLIDDVDEPVAIHDGDADSQD